MIGRVSAQTFGKRPARNAGGPGLLSFRRLRALGFSYGFLAPALLIYAVFVLYPIVQAFFISLTDWNGSSPSAHEIGLANYSEIGRDPAVWASVLHVLIWLLVNITLAPVLGIAMATLVNQRWVKGKGIFRTIFFLPATISAVVIGLIWQWVYNPLYGILDAAFRALGFPGLAIDWLGTPGSALIAVAVANSWQNGALFFIFYLAGLQQIPAELHEAAYLEGATGWQAFRNVSLPLLKPTTTTVVALGIIWSLRQFDLVWTMTQGGPGNSTETLGTYIYRTAFLFNRMGYSAALSVILLVVTLAVSQAFIWWRER